VKPHHPFEHIGADALQDSAAGLRMAATVLLELIDTGTAETPLDFGDVLVASIAIPSAPACAEGHGQTIDPPDPEG